MKSLIIILALILCSCKKDYVCECSRWTKLGETQLNYTIENSTKYDARQSCAAKERDYDNFKIHNCHLE